MINEKEYGDFVNSVSEFVVTCLELNMNQHNINLNNQSQCNDIRQVIKSIGKVVEGHLQLLGEYEQRISILERIIDEYEMQPQGSKPLRKENN